MESAAGCGPVYTSPILVSPPNIRGCTQAVEENSLENYEVRKGAKVRILPPPLIYPNSSKERTIDF